MSRNPRPIEADQPALPELCCADGRVFPLRETRIRASVAGSLFEAELVQVFRNPFQEKLDATYVFPISGGAVVRELWMEVGDRKTRAECRERGAAEQRFQQARSAGHRAGIVTQERDEVLTLELASIAPGEQVRVGVRFADRSIESDGEYVLRIPLVCGEKYNPASVQDPERVNPVRFADPADAPSLDIQVLLEGAGRPIRSVQSTLFALQTEMEAPDRVRVSLARKADKADRDFKLSYRLAGEQSEARLYTEADGADQVFLLELSPPASPPEKSLPRDVFFVLDVSGSMSGVKIDAARKALQGLLRSLDEGDRFDIFWFNTSWGRFSPTDDPLPLSQSNLDSADRWIQRLHASGGTEMLDPLLAATSGSSATGRLRLVVFLTDGEVGNERELLERIAPRVGEARLFTFGVDTAVNASFLRRLAAMGRGTCELMSPHDDIEKAVARFGARFGAPLVRGIQLHAQGEHSIELDSLTPAPIPDLFQGRPLSVLGRVKGSAPLSLRIEGQAEASLSWQATAVPVQAGLRALWARASIEALDDQLLLGAGNRGAVEEKCRQIALKHGILSSFTAFVVVDESGVVQGEARHVNQPALQPEAWADTVQMCVVPQGRMPAMAPPPCPSPAPSFHARMMSKKVDALMAPSEAPMRQACIRSEILADEFDAECCEAGAMKSESAAPHKGKRSRDGDLSGLIRTQRADGSFGDIHETAAVLLALILLGHTDRKGIRQRNVAKAARFLADHLDRIGAAGPLARAAFDALARETGDSRWEQVARQLADQGHSLPVGQALLKDLAQGPAAQLLASAIA